MTVLMSCVGMKKDFGELTVLKDISFDIGMGERIGLVGKNGSGKTTIANIIFGKLEHDGGEIIWNKRDIKIGYLFQSTFYTSHTLNDMFISNRDSLNEFFQTTSNLGMEKVQQWDTERFNVLSGGEKTKLALANIWALKPNLLILDEPTNHLDFQGIQWLVDEIKNYEGTIIIISHDRYFLDESVDRILEIEEGVINNYKGNYSYYRNEKRKRYESQLHAYLAQKKYKQKIESDIEQLKSWSYNAHKESNKKAVRVGRKKGGKEHYRAKAKKKDKQVKSKLKRIEKIEIEGVKKPKEEEKISFAFDSAPKKGRRILEALNITKVYGDNVLFENSSFYIQRGDRIGLFGSNGCGKTTLIKAIMGEETLDNGELLISPSAQLAYLSQDVLDLDDKKTIVQVFDISSKEKRSKVQTLLSNMGFSEVMINKPIKYLSLGERTRVKVAQLIINKNNILILDEPTNHLDLHSREKLEETLEYYNGTILLVSHDRYMLERICNKLLVFKDNKIKRLEYDFKTYINKECEKDIKRKSDIVRERLNITSPNYLSDPPDRSESLPKVPKTLDNLQTEGELIFKPTLNNEEEKLIIENRLAYLVGELSKYNPEDPEYIRLDSEFSELINRKG